MCDNIWNIAPCGNMVMGEPAFLSEEFSSAVDPDLELVTTSGYGKNGALSVLQVCFGGISHCVCRQYLKWYQTLLQNLYTSSLFGGLITIC